MDDLINEFLVETTESLDTLDQEVVQLEQNPDDQEIIRNIFRVMHTIKGTCGFLGLTRLESVAHSAENIMDKVRDGKFKMTPEITSMILEAIDVIKAVIEYMEEHSVEPEGDDSELISRLNSCADNDGKIKAAVPCAEPAASESANDALPDISTRTTDLDEEIDFEPVMAESASDVLPDISTRTIDLDEEIDFEPVMAESAISDIAATVPEPALAPKAVEAKPPATSSADDDLKKQAINEGLKAADKAPTKAAATQSIRVGIDVLEGLMQMVGELVLTRNQLLQMLRSNNSENEEVNKFSAPLQQLNHITTELQEGIIQTRMQPIGNAWAKFPRMIRDLALELDKKIDLKMIGAETDLDRQMLEAIKDPLTHMVRNSADHGIEIPSERLAAGKSETGSVTLSAYHEGGHIIIKIADDGKGLDVEKIKGKALENELATADELKNMTNKQIYQFIYSPGFSTAEAVTAVSGRGVGMDVVVTNIQKTGGTVELDSTPGKGSEFLIKLPLTLAIMPVLIIQSADEVFAIPQIRVLEVVRADKKSSKHKHSSDGGDNETIDHKIETLNGSPVLRLRGRLLPLISLSKTLGIQNQKDFSLDVNTLKDVTPEDEVDNSAAATDDDYVTSEDDSQPSHTDDIEPFIVVCEIGSQQCGILVDKVYHTEEIVVKPIASIMNHLDVYAGCTILGDGNVIMIIDPSGVVKASSIRDIGEAQKDDMDEKELIDDNIASFLTFKAWDKAPKAVPLELVSRLEETDMSKVEWSGDNKVVQYRDKLMRLITLNPSGELPDSGNQEIIVFTDRDNVLGLVVEEILDIAKQKMDMKSLTSKDGVLGSLVIDGKAMDLLDISYFFSHTFSDWLGGAGVAEKTILGEEKSVKKHILLVDDSPFFRKFMKPVLVVADYNVTTAEDAIEALEILNNSLINFDIIVTDIEMPKMDGIEFLKTCRDSEKFANIPFVALSSYNESDLPSPPSELGFNGFVLKSQRNDLVKTISEVLTSAKQLAQ